MTDHLPEPQAGGLPVPPPRVPDTALASASSLLPRARSTQVDWRARKTGIAAFLAAALDGLDVLGDRIATAAGLR